MAIVEGKDFYIENGKYVFTYEFLEKRGYCCECGCRHCPYRKKEAEKPIRIELHIDKKVKNQSITFSCSYKVKKKLTKKQEKKQ